MGELGVALVAALLLHLLHRLQETIAANEFAILPAKQYHNVESRRRRSFDSRAIKEKLKENIEEIIPGAFPARLERRARATAPRESHAHQFPYR